MKDSINLWFIDSDKKRRVPQVFSKVLMNFMLGRYPTSVFERFSKYRLEYILGELLTKTTDKNFFSEMRPIWWPESIEFVPLSVLHQKIEKGATTWILHLQELLLSAREFYSEQLYLPSKRCNTFKSIKENKSKGKAEKAKHKPKICIKISPAIFKPFRNENTHPNIMPNIVQNAFAKSNDSHLTHEIHHESKSVMEPRNIIHIDETTSRFQTSIVDQCLNRTHESLFPSISWRPYVYLNDILRKEPIDLTHYASENCQVKLHDILKINQFDKASYMKMLGLYESPTTITRQKMESPRTVNYKRYSPSVPFSSMGGQLIIGSLKGRYYRNTNCERNARRGCSINDPLYQKYDAVPNIADTKNKNSRKIQSYHVYKFCRRRPFNSLDLPDKIRDQYCRNTIVKVHQLSATDLKAYMPHCKVMLTRILPSHAKYLQKYNVDMSK